MRAIPQELTKLKTSRFPREMSNESSSRSLKKASVERTIKITKHALTGMPVVRLHSAKYSGNKPSLPND